MCSHYQLCAWVFIDNLRFVCLILSLQFSWCDLFKMNQIVSHLVSSPSVPSCAVRTTKPSPSWSWRIWTFFFSHQFHFSQPRLSLSLWPISNKPQDPLLAPQLWKPSKPSLAWDFTVALWLDAFCSPTPTLVADKSLFIQEDSVTSDTSRNKPFPNLSV